MYIRQKLKDKLHKCLKFRIAKIVKLPLLYTAPVKCCLPFGGKKKFLKNNRFLLLNRNDLLSKPFDLRRAWWMVSLFFRHRFQRMRFIASFSFFVRRRFHVGDVTFRLELAARRRAAVATRRRALAVARRHFGRLRRSLQLAHGERFLLRVRVSRIFVAILGNCHAVDALPQGLQMSRVSPASRVCASRVQELTTDGFSLQAKRRLSGHVDHRLPCWRFGLCVGKVRCCAATRTGSLYSNEVS